VVVGLSLPVHVGFTRQDLRRYGSWCSTCLHAVPVRCTRLLRCKRLLQVVWGSLLHTPVLGQWSGLPQFGKSLSPWRTLPV